LVRVPSTSGQPDRGELLEAVRPPRLRAPEFSPFLFKLRAPHNAICGFAYFASFSRLPAWLAWETFGVGNGCSSFADMLDRIATIRARIGYQEGPDSNLIGCVLLVQPVFFPPDAWIEQPSDWPARTQSDKRYDLSAGIGKNIWDACLAVANDLARASDIPEEGRRVAEVQARYAEPTLVRPRLGQGTFRIAVTDAYDRACAITREHSLPALDAAHIRSYESGGPHEVSNGLLLRADLHRLLDNGYITLTPSHRVLVSSRLRTEYDNGHTYYPLEGVELNLPRDTRARPDPEHLRWHNEAVFAE
jgi:putative restriction endonuclease